MRTQRTHSPLRIAVPTIGLPQLYTADLVCALLASTGFGFALATFYLLPAYLVRVHGATPSEIGRVTGAFGLATVIGAPLTGAVIDRISRRWLIATAGFVMAATCVAFAAMSELGYAVYALRALQGVCFAVVFTTVGALVADLAPPARLSEALGLTGASMLAMSALVPAIVEPLVGAYGWAPAFLLAGCASASASLLAIMVAEPVRSEAPDAQAPDTQALDATPIWRRRATHHYALVTAALGGAFGVMTTYTQPFAFELGRADVGGFFASYGTMALVVRVVLGRQVDRLGRFRVATFALNLYTVVVLVGALGMVRLLELVGATLGVAHGLFFPAFNALAANNVQARERGRLFAVFTGAFYGGMGAATVAAGVLAAHAGYRLTYVATALVTVAAGVLMGQSSEFAKRSER
jgi:MFS family permease